MRAGGDLSSSWIESFSFSEAGAREILTVVTKVGETYKYKDVPRDIYKKMTTSESAGKFHNSTLRGKYTFVKV